MPKYNVSIEIDYKSFYEDEIEAEDEAAAEAKAEENYYNDEYEDDLRMNMETHDEQYHATEIIPKETCPVCTKTYSEDGEAPDDYFYGRVKKFNESDSRIIHPQYSKEEEN
jgi:hypothetical protein